MDSFLKELSRTQDCPSHDQCHQFKLQSMEYSGKILEVEEALDVLKEHQRKLQAKLITLEFKRDVYASLLAPIRRMPLEVLLEIFEYSLPVDLEDRRPTTSQAPLSLCQVSSSWRRICLATPRLWSQLSIFFDKQEDFVLRPTLKQRKIMLDEWFLRLGPKRLLSVHFDSGSAHADSGANKFVRRFMLLFSHRLRQLSLRFSFGAFDSVLCDQDEQFENLESITLISRSIDPWNANGNQVTLSLMTAKHLRSVCVHDIFKDCLAPRLSLPWHQLTFLKTGVIDAFPLLNILVQCVNLEVGDFSVTNAASPLPIIEITLPRIHHFRLQFPLEGSVRLFDGISLPALKALDFKLDELSTPISFLWEDPKHFFSQIRSITTLVFSGQIDCDAFDIVDLLRSTPLLVSLTLASDDNFDAFLRAMAISSHKPILAPILESLRIIPLWYKWTFSSPPDFSPALFVAMLKSRTFKYPLISSPLQHIIFEGNRSHLEGIRASIEILESQNIPVESLPLITIIQHDVRLTLIIAIAAQDMGIDPFLGVVAPRLLGQRQLLEDARAGD
ncbi:hypothetical protein DXG01_012358 [Tephrocybe rancida]|nr:hypothetical protein DXG01_012358 [Tephrocybe rancida]